MRTPPISHVEQSEQSALRTRRRLSLPTVATLSGLIALLAVCMALSGQDSPPPAEQTRNVYAELAKVSARELSRPNPLEHDPDAVAAGSKLFGEHCSNCHGDRAQGTREGPSLSVSQVQRATPGSLFSILTNGVVRRGMPVWSKLPEPQRWQLVTFLKSLENGTP